MTRATAQPERPLPPAGLRVRLAPGTVVRDGGRIVLGGAPSRLLRLTDRGAELVLSWQPGGEIGPGRALARRLLDAGALLPEPDPADARDLAVVVPTHGRAAQLARCLDSITATAPGADVVVVDDGSPDPAAIESVARARGARVVRHASSRGPSEARNTGFRATDRELVAFVDSDVVVLPATLPRLAGHFADPALGAAAPRILALEDTGTLASYERDHSSLDMGRLPGRVRPGAPVPYVPSATLVIRRAAFGRGFDRELTIGEDVDLVWRIAEAGWGVQYDPSVAVRHEHRTDPRELLERRFVYATSIGLLAARHPSALPAVHVDEATAVVALLLSRRPALAALVAGRVVWRTRALLAGRTADPTRFALRLTAQAVWRAARALAHAARRPWWPVLAVTRPRLLAAAWAVGIAERRPARPAHAALCIADDLVSGAGTWWSCARYRTARPLLPLRRAPR